MASVNVHILGDLQKSYEDAKRSAQLPEHNWDYERTDAKPPPAPYEFHELGAFLETSTSLYRCVKTLAISTVGLGYDLVVAPGVKKDQATDEHRRVLDEFFRRPNRDMTWGEIIECMVVDYASIGNAYLEVRRDKRGWGRPAAVEHVPAATVRVRKDKNGFIQVRDNRRSYFRNFGNPPKPEDASRDPDFEYCFHPEDRGKPIAERRILNELIHFRNYHPRSSYYGLPDWLPALRAILGNLKVGDFNSTFFENNAVPQYLFVIKGGEIGDDAYKQITNFFEQEVKGNAHKTLILHVRKEEGEEVDVEARPLATDVKDSSFRMYRADNAEEIRIAYGVPGRLIGITEKGGLGGAGEGTSQQEVFKYHVIEPMRRRIEHRINNFLIKEGFGFEDWEYRFRDVDITDTSKRAEYINKLVRLGVMTINEAREKMNLEPLDTVEYPMAGQPIIIEPSGMATDLREFHGTAKRPTPEEDERKGLVHLVRPGMTVLDSLIFIRDELGKAISAEPGREEAAELLKGRKAG